MDEPVLTWRETSRRLGQDAERLRPYQASKFGYSPLTWFLDPSWVCVCLYRLSHLAWSHGHRNFGRLCMQANSILTGADIQPGSDLGGGFLIPSPFGATISCKAGANLTALALAGFGGSVRDRDIGAGIGQPVVGDDVTAAQFTGIQGSIRLGNHVVVDFGAGAVVDVADGTRMILAVEPQIAQAPIRPPETRAPSPYACQHRSWAHTRAAFDADIARYLDEMGKYAPPGSRRPRKLSAILTNSLLALSVYRASHWLFLNNHRWFAHKLCQLNFLIHKLTIPPESCIGPGVLMPHLAGTIFSGRAGRNLTLYANSLCMGQGSGAALSTAQSPVLADSVSVGGHSGVFGPVDVGNRVQLGPKVQLDQSVPDDTQVWSSMARGTDRPRGAPAAAAIDSSVFGPVPPTRSLPVAAPWRETRRRLARDRLRLREAAGQDGISPSLYPAFVCVALFRLSHYCWFIGARRLARWLWMANVYLTGADIAPSCEIGAGLLIPYPAGIALHCRSGDDLTVLATTGIATSLTAEGQLKDLSEAPQLGNDILLSHHSGIYGAVRIGTGVRVTPGCIVTRSVPPGATLVPRALKFRGPAAAGRQRPRRDAASLQENGQPTEPAAVDYPREASVAGP